jgi:hypothetical protein
MQADALLLDELRDLDVEAAASRVSTLPDDAILETLQALGPGRGFAILNRLGAVQRTRITSAAGTDASEHWLASRAWPEGSVGRLTEPRANHLRGECQSR